MSDEDWIPMYAHCALHMQGFGGLSDFDTFTEAQWHLLCRELDDYARRKAKAASKGK